MSFVSDRYEVCDGIRCASVVVRDGRRTILLAREAFSSDERLRMSLLEVWERYEQPRPGSVPDLARAALRVLTDGGRVGAGSPANQRRARNVYRGLWESLPEDRRSELPRPEGVGAKAR